MKLNTDLMTREEMLMETSINRGNQYTTEEMWETGDYVVTDRNGYLYYANGEEVMSDEDLPETGWFDCTDMDNDSYNENYYDSYSDNDNYYDIDDEFVVKKVHNTISRLYKNDGKESGICVIEARNFSFDSPRLTGSINDNGKYGSKWISKENLLKVIPLFCLCRDSYGENGKIIEKDGNIKYDYRVIGTLYKTSDKFDEYQQDNIFLQNCLLWCLTTHLNQCSNKCKIWSYGESILDSKLKDNKIWKIYKELVNDTGLNGLYNIEQFNKIEYGKLWKEHNLYPKIKEVKQLLDIFYRDNIRPYFFKYDLLK